MTASAGEGRAVLVLPEFDIARNLLDRLLVNHRADIDLGISAVADAQSFRPLDQLAGEFLVDLLVHDQARRGGATLSRSAKRSPDGALDGIVDVGVIHHDD